MMGGLHELRKSEEGQTLVLAAIFGLILMVCVLGTVNLGRAVYDKVQLQAAADSSAYSLAAVEARVMNFTAYTNRAMVVHFASAMAATSYLTWVHFIWAGLKPLLTVLSNVPYIGPIFQVIKQVFVILVRVLDIGVMMLCGLVCMANMYIYALQEGAWNGTYGRLLQTIQPEAHSGDSARHPYQPIWSTLLPLANATVFSQTRGHKLMFDNTFETAKIFINDKSDVIQAARLQMMEIANSARQPWVAYGDRYNNPTVSPLARHFDWSFSLGPASAGLTSVARTEAGVYSPQGGIIGTAKALFPTVWSGQRFQFHARLKPFPGLNINLFSFVAMDQMFNPDLKHLSEWSYYKVVNIPSWVPILGGISKAIDQAAKDSAPNPDYRPFWMSPYVYFSPRAKSAPQSGPFGLNGNFNQPDVVVGLALQGRDYNQEEGAAKVYGRKFTWGGGAAGVGATDFSYTNKDRPQLGGIPLLPQGFNAFSAAQVYYHRPGDWKEHPNFFNPLWGARLMPVRESNAWARAGLDKLTQLIAMTH